MTVRVLILAEHDGAALSTSTGRCVSCARLLAPERIDVLVLAEAVEPLAAEAASLDGVSKVLCVASPVNKEPLAAVLAPQIASLARGYTHLFGPSTTFGKDVLPRVAALLGVGQLSDIMHVEDAYTFKRPTYAGNAVVTVKAPPDRLLVATVRTASYPDPGTAPPAPVEIVSVDCEIPTHTRFVKRESAASERPDLQTASRVVSGGRALGSRENFALIYRLADSMRAAVGASRAAVDSGFAGNDMQVGQTGKIIAPQLYVAVGISGAIQHLTGIKDAGTIVAINKDPDAAIFEIADIGLVADLFQAVPELIAAIEGS